MPPRKGQAEGEETFEALFAQLEEKARRLEQGNLPLEDSLQLYEEGAALVDRLRAVLEGAELRMRNVQGRFEQDVNLLREVEAEYEAEDQ
jgi:exodeoxyribonuclease VII small subunit